MPDVDTTQTANVTTRAIRGATTIDADTAEQILARVNELMTEVFARNGLTAEDAISLMITATADIHSFHPATAARRWGLDDVPIMGAQEIDITGGLPLCIRTMLHVHSTMGRHDAQHVFLHGATALRPDLVDKRADS